MLRVAVGTLLALPALGCRDRDLTTQPTLAALAPSSALQQPSFADDDGEQLFRSLSKVAPSSAGFYYDQSGTLVVRVRDAIDDAASLSFVRQLLRQNPGFGPGGGRRMLGLRTEPADFTFAELSQARRIASIDILGRVPGVVTVDVTPEI